MLCSRSASFTSSTDVLGDRQDELAQILGLALVVGGDLQPRELGHPFDQFADLRPEQRVDVGAGDVGVLDHVMQQGGDDAGGVEAVFGQDARHLDRMGEVGIAGRAGLAAVHLHRIDIGAVDQRLVGAGVVGADPLDQLILAQELLTRRLRPRGRRLRRRGGGGCRRGRGGALDGLEAQ
jgi:hypothetical protein